MLTIGEFSSICRVSTKTLRYYAEIGLILPEEINPVLVPGDRDHILSGVFNQFLSALTEPVE